MSEDVRTLWVGNLHEDVTDELIYELFLQTGPIEKLIFPTEGEGDEKKHKGIAYILFKHPESVKFSSQVMEGTKLFGKALEMKARSMPITYRSTPPSQHNRPSRFSDNNSLRGGFNRTNTWHGRSDFQPRGRGGPNFQSKGNNFNNQNTSGNFNPNFNNFNNQLNSGFWNQPQQANNKGDMDNKRQRMIQQQNMMIQGANFNQQQQQQNMMGMYNMQQQPQQSWNQSGFNQGQVSWNTTNMYQQQYGNQFTGGTWYQPQQ